MANVVYNSFKKDMADGVITLSGDTFNVMLVTASYTPDIDTHAVRSDVTNEVAAGGNYSTGGQALGSIAVTQDNTNDWAKFDAANSTWSTSTITARGAVVYQDTGNASTDRLVAYFDFGSDQSSSSGDFTINWNTDGLLTMS